jgi:hypothetical protein
LMPIPFAKLPKTWMSVTANIVGLNLLSKLAGDYSVERAKEKAIANGNPEGWVGELLTEGIPSFVINAIFGSLVKSAKQGNTEAQRQIDTMPPEVTEAIQPWTPEKWANITKVLDMPLLKTVEQTPRQVDVLASKGEIPLEVSQPPEVTPETMQKAVTMPPEGVKTGEPISTTPPVGEGVITKTEYPVAGNMVDGRKVRSNVPNTSSIDASVPNNESLSGIREIPMSDFKLTGKHYSVEGDKRIAELTDQIKTSSEISPLIVVLEKDGPYILEGATRADALFRLGAKSFPAKIVVNLDSPPEGYKPPLPPAAQPEVKQQVAQQPIQGEPNAIEKRKIAGGNKPEYIPPSQEGATAETGNRNRNVGGGNVTETQGKVAEVKPITEPIPPSGEQVREVAEMKPYRVELNEKDLITKPLSEIQKSAKAMDIPTENRTRKDVVDDIKTKQDEVQKEKLIDEMPIPEELKRKRGLRNRMGAIGFEKPLEVKTKQVDDVSKTQAMFNKQRSDVKDKYKVTMSKIRDDVSSAVFGTDIPITRRLMDNNGKDVVIAKVLSRGWRENLYQRKHPA